MQKTNPPEWLTPSVTVLILANLIPVYGMVFLGWNVFIVIFLFWTENVIIGVFNAVRMLAVFPKNPLVWLAKLFLIPFFCFHYGMFTAVHGLFVIMLFGREFIGTPSEGLPNIIDIFSLIFRQYRLIYAVLALLVSHGFSFFWNYIGKGEFRSVSLVKLMGQPYARVVVLHITIIFGGFMVMALNSPVLGLFLLLGIKIGVDIVAHMREHNKLRKDIL